MSYRSVSYLFILAALLLSGCATQQYYNDILSTWEGQPANRLVQKWGYPDRKTEAPSGNAVYVYETSNSYTTPITTKKVGKGKHAYWQTTGGQTQTYSCSTFFEVDRKKRIVNWHAKGNSCTAMEGGSKESLRANAISVN